MGARRASHSRTKKRRRKGQRAMIPQLITKQSKPSDDVYENNASVEACQWMMSEWARHKEDRGGGG